MTEEFAEQVTAVTFTSPAGVYVVLTLSSAVYVIDLENADRAPTVTRYGVGSDLLYDEQPLPAVVDLRFDLSTGQGFVFWEKPDVETQHAIPSYTYIGTIRWTSTPIWIGRTTASALADLQSHLLEVRQHAPAGREPSGQTDFEVQ